MCAVRVDVPFFRDDDMSYGYDNAIRMIGKKTCPQSMIDDYIEMLYSVNHIDEKSQDFLRMISKYADRFGYYEF